VVITKVILKFGVNPLAIRMVWHKNAMMHKNGKCPLTSGGLCLMNIGIEIVK
jgi:hypothetical protein